MKKTLYSITALLLLSNCTQSRAPIEYRKINTWKKPEQISVPVTNDEQINQLNNINDISIDMENSLQKQEEIRMLDNVELELYELINAEKTHESLVELPKKVSNSTTSLDNLNNELHSKVENLTNKTNQQEKTPDQTSNNQIKFHLPVQGKIINKCGSTVNGVKLNGINISAKLGEEIVACADGIVESISKDNSEFGNIIVIKLNKHANMLVAYTYLQDIAVKVGEHVKAGSKIGRVGLSTSAKKPLLHFAVKINDQIVDPENHLIADIPK